MKLSTFLKTSALGIAIASPAYAVLLANDIEDELKKAKEKVIEFGTSATAEIFDAINKSSIVADFSKKSTKLKTTQEVQVEALLKSVDDLSHYTITIAAWSDEPYPYEEDKSLSEHEVKLAANRIAVLEAFIRDKARKESLEVETFNFGEKLTFMEKIFSTDESEVKKAYEEGEKEDPVAANKARVLREKGGPRKVVVILTKHE